MDIAALYVHIGPHGHKALDMLVDGTAAQITSARRGNLRAAEAAEEGPDQVVGGPDLAGQLLRDLGIVDMAAINVHRRPVDGAHIGAQILKDIQDQRNVADLRDILDPADAVHQQGGRDNGNGRVLRAADGNLTKKRFPAVNHILCQDRTFYSPVREDPAVKRPDELRPDPSLCHVPGGRKAAHLNAKIL